MTKAVDKAIQALERKQLSRNEFIYGLKACGFTVKDGQTYYEEQELIKCFDDLFFSQELSKPTGIMLYPQVEGITPTVVKPQESDHKCHTCKHYTSGERDGSCGSYICKNYSNWERSDKE